jgi:hypothetical protein
VSSTIVHLATIVSPGNRVGLKAYPGGLLSSASSVKSPSTASPARSYCSRRWFAFRHIASRLVWARLEHFSRSRPAIPVQPTPRPGAAGGSGASDGARGEALKRRLRTGTVVSYDDRNWELRWSQERRRINLSRAIAVDMESGTLATQGYRLRVPYGTLLCVSDKPLHGEIKLPGAASAFYQRAVGEHLQIGLTALDILRDQLGTLHSRKLRSFDEPPFR